MYQRVLHVLAYASDQVKAKNKNSASRARCGAKVGGRRTFEKGLLIVDTSLQ